MPGHFADRLIESVRGRNAPAAVALDPVLENLPSELRTSNPLDGMRDFCRGVLRVIAPIVPVVKINSAYFERYHAAGVKVYGELVSTARRHGLMVIGDVKRGDVGHTATMYAHAHLGESESEDEIPDAITVSGYFGIDGVRPFIDAAARFGRGVFVLVRTSNPSAAALQDLALADGRKVHEAVAAQVDAWAKESVGACGYSSVGAVVATRRAEDAARLRAAMPHSVFLVPGYGAQGGRAEDFKPYLHAGGAGALIAAGRSVIFAYEQDRYRTAATWESAVEAACRDFVADLVRVI